MHRTLGSAGLLLAIFLAGCATDEPLDAQPSPSPPSEPDPGTGEVAAPAMVVTTDRFGWSTGAGNAGDLLFCTACENGASFDVPADATQVEVDIEWTCRSDPCDIDAALYPPDEERSAWHEQGPSPLSVAIASPQDGQWRFPINPDGVSVDLQGVATVTVHLAG